jgi:hypothetical protein
VPDRALTSPRQPAGCNRLGDEGLAVLAGLVHVEELDVRMNGVGPRGVEALAARRGGMPLRFLGIEDNPIGDPGLLTMARSGLLGEAEVAILISVDITADGLRGAAAYPRQNPGRLRLGLNALGDRGIDALLSGPAIAGLIELSLPFNDIGSTTGLDQLRKLPWHARGSRRGARSPRYGYHQRLALRERRHRRAPPGDLYPQGGERYYVGDTKVTIVAFEQGIEIFPAGRAQQRADPVVVPRSTTSSRRSSRRSPRCLATHQPG